MTPAEQQGVWGFGRWARPSNATATETHIEWTESWVDTEGPEWGIEGLLDAYCALASAQPEEMAAFVNIYGAPEIGGMTVTEGRESNPFGFAVQSRRAGSIPVRELRWHARATEAARRIGALLVMRRCGDRDDWADVVNHLVPHYRGIRVGIMDALGDWKLEREFLARVITDFLEDAQVYIGADWLGARRLAMEPRTGTFVGVIAILLAREVGAEGAYQCDCCGARVDRSRPPRRNERVYCSRAECKREQRRRNQAAWRAKKAEKEARDG